MSERGSGDVWSAAAAPGSGREAGGDRWLARPLAGGASLCAVADSEAGSVSEVALAALHRHLAEASDPLDRGLHQAAAAAVGDALAAIAEGTRASMAWVTVTDGGALFGWLGHCRVGRLRAGGLTWLTRDHSLAEQLLLEEQLTPAEARDHPCRKVLVRSFGVDREADVVALDPRPGDALVLCTDGVYDALADAQIALVAAGGAEALVAAAASGGAGRAAVLVRP